MKQNWFLILAILAILAIPFGLALFEDSTSTTSSDDFNSETVLSAPLSTPLSAPKSRALNQDDDDDLAMWSRRDPLDLSFIDDFLGPSPGLSTNLLASARDRSHDRSSLKEFAQRSNHIDVSLKLKKLTDSTAAIPTVEILFDNDVRVYQQLVSRWGTPTLNAPTHPPARLAAWLTADVRVVSDAESTPQRIVVGPYTQFEKILELGFLGRGKDSLKTVEDIMLAFPDRHLVRSADEIEFSVLPIEESREAETVFILSLDGRQLRSVSSTIDFSLAPQRQAQILAILTRRFGRPTHEASAELSFANHPGLSLFVYPTRIVIYQDL